MEVILKKSKITNSILKQTISPKLDMNLSNYQNLGWCIYNKERYIILYDAENSLLYRLLTFDRIDINEEKTRMALCKSRYTPRYLDYTKELHDLLLDIHDNAINTKGQFYI